MTVFVEIGSSAIKFIFVLYLFFFLGKCDCLTWPNPVKYLLWVSPLIPCGSTITYGAINFRTRLCLDVMVDEAASFQPNTESNEQPIL